MDFYLYNNNFCVRNCVVPSCQGQHFIKFTNGRAKIPTWEFFEIERHYKRNIVELCGPACPNKNLCLLHQKLECFKFFSDYIRDRNINRNDIATKILIKENCEHKMCLNNWYFEIYETKYFKDCSLSISWRSKFL